MRIIRVTALWCMSCLAMKSVWRKVFSSRDNLEIIDYDYDDSREEILKYQVGDVLPVLIIYKNGQEVKRIIGEKSKKELDKILKEIEDENY
jgi:thioredoxin 1